MNISCAPEPHFHLANLCCNSSATLVPSSTTLVPNNTLCDSPLMNRPFHVHAVYAYLYGVILNTKCTSMMIQYSTSHVNSSGCLSTHLVSEIVDFSHSPWRRKIKASPNLTWDFETEIYTWPLFCSIFLYPLVVSSLQCKPQVIQMSCN